MDEPVGWYRWKVKGKGGTYNKQMETVMYYNIYIFLGISRNVEHPRELTNWNTMNYNDKLDIGEHRFSPRPS